MRVEESARTPRFVSVVPRGNEGQVARGNFEYGIVTMTARRENVRRT